MSNKVTITIEEGLSASEIFIVTDVGLQKKLTKLGFESGLLSAPKGLNNWTKTHGVAYEELEKNFRSKTMILLLDRSITNGDKGGKFVAELTATLRDLGGRAVAPILPPTMPPATLLEAFLDETSGLVPEQLVEFLADTTALESLAKSSDTSGGSFDFPDTLSAEDDKDGSKRVFAYVLPQVRAVKGRDNLYYAAGTDSKGPLGKRYYSLDEDFFNVFASDYYDETGEVMKSSHRSNLLAKLKGTADTTEASVKLVKQSFHADGVVWVDMGRRDCKVLRVTTDGWSVEDMPQSDEFGFLKVEDLPAMEMPKQVGSVEEAWKVLETNLRPFVCVTDSDWSLIVGWILNHFTGAKRPFIQLMASDGVGKTTTSSALSYLLQGGPEVEDNGSSADDVRSLKSVLSSTRINVFDNISKIDEDMSELLCQADKPTVYKARKLYSDAGVSKTIIDTSIILSGITIDGMENDLRGRLIPVKLHKPKSTFDGDINGFQVANHPETYGALLTLVSAVLRHFGQAPNPTKKYGVDIRMIDYAGVLWTLDELGLTQNAGSAYANALRDDASAAHDDPFVRTVVRLLLLEGNFETNTDTGEVVGRVTSKDVLSLYNRMIRYIDEYSEYEKLSSRTILNRIRRGQSTWKKVGIYISDESERVTVNGSKLTTYAVHIKDVDMDFLVELQQENQLAEQESLGLSTN